MQNVVEGAMTGDDGHGCEASPAEAIQSSGIKTLRTIRLILTLLILRPAAQAQSPAAGVISGHVRGPGGVSVPGATVQITEKATGARKETWSDEEGDFTLKDVSPGNYKLVVSLLGFREDIRDPLAVVAGKTLRVDVALVMALRGRGDFPSEPQRPGTPPGPANLDSSSPEFRARLRNFEVQGSGAVPSGEGPAGPGGSLRFSEGVTSGGLPGSETTSDAESAPTDASASAASSFLLSGSVGRAPTPGDQEGDWRQRMQEFRRYQQSQSAPGFGGGGEFEGGAMIWAGSWGRRRAQVNRVRGNFFERYSNSSLNAHPYPLNVAESPQIRAYQEQVGFSLGGPLTIPGIYPGRDKTNYFVHYHLQRSHDPFDSFATVPTLAERGGDFSAATIPSSSLAGMVPTLYDPFSNPRGPRAQFPGNQIPPSRFDSAAAALLNFIPLPNLPGAVQNFHLQEALPSANDRFLGRLGHQISDRDSVNAFYFFNSSRSEAVSNFPALTRHTSIRSQNLNWGETHTFSPRLVNNLALNFNRQRTSTLNPFAFQEDISGELGIQGISEDPRDWGLPIVNFTNFAALNDTIPSLTRNQTFRAFDFLIFNRGKHNLRFGGEVRRVQVNTLTNPDARGTFTFNGFATSDFTLQGFPVPGTGLDFADFLLGLPQATSVRFGKSSNYFRSWVYSAFVQDDWRVSSRLTFNLGFRYEDFQPFNEKYDRLSDLSIGEGFSTVGVVTGQAPGSFPPSLIRPDGNNFAPRLGLAFRPWTKHSLVFRAGYGIFYDSSIFARLVPNLANQPPFAQASTLLTSPDRVLTLEDGFPSIAPNVARNTYAVDPNFRTPYGQTWNLGVEEEFARNMILSIGYVGTKGSKLDLLLGPNRAAPGSSLTTEERLALKNALQFIYETSGASSIYHALQVGLRRQFHTGLSMSADYTFSKSIDDAAGVGGSGHTVTQNTFDLKAERGLSIFDVRHRLVFDHTYELPWGDGKRYFSHGGLLAALFGNWQISGRATLQSGTPFTARILGNQSNNSGTGAYFSERADATGLRVSVPGFEQSTLRYFNTSAFTLPVAGQYGNAGRNTIPGPRTVQFNTSVDRFITLSREKNVQLDFRVEANNVFNTPAFNSLSTVVNAADFGRVTGVSAMRTLTFSMRVRF